MTSTMMSRCHGPNGIADDLAMAIGQDTANARMRKAGRKKWTRADYNASVRAFYRCYGTTAEQFHRDTTRRAAGTAQEETR